MGNKAGCIKIYIYNLRVTLQITPINGTESCISVIRGTFIINVAEKVYILITYFHWKIIALAGIWTSELPSTKPMRYRLSYPGLDNAYSV